MTTNKDLLAKRGYIKGSVTRIITFIDKYDKEKSGAGELISRLEKLENKWSEYENVYLQLISLDENNTTELKDELNTELEDFENIFYSARSNLTELISQVTSSSLSTSSSYNTACSVNQNTNAPTVKLPVINLPTFSGGYESWFSFHDTFVSLIETNRSLSQVQKFYYLKSCLTDEAEKLLQSIDVTNDNYTIAWKLLKDRFENKQLIIRKTVESLINPGYVKQESASGLRHLLDSTVKNLRVLDQLGEPTKHWDTIIVHIVLSRVDPGTRREWESRSDITYPVKFETLSTFLQNRCKMLESVESHCQLQTSSSNNQQYTSSSNNQQYTKTSKQSLSKTFTAAASINTNSSEPLTQESTFVTKSTQSCKICKQSHFTQNCEIILRMNVEDRIAEVKKRNLCLNCLRYGHFVADCKSSKCRKCNQTHNTILHIDKIDRISEMSSQQIQPEEASAPQETISNLCAHSVNTTTVFLATAIVKVKDKFGSYYTCRALLDSASQSNFISEQLCQILQLERKESEMPVYLLEGTSTKVTHSVNTTIKSRLNEYSANLDFSILSHVTGKLPCIHVNTADWNIPKNIILADPKFNVPNKIDMLIGAKLFFKIFSIGEIELSPNLPTFKKTVFGWILGGEASQQSEMPPSIENRVYSCHVYSSPMLNDQLSKFWTIEDCSKKQHMTKEEVECEEFFKENYCRDNTSGRFTVKLPIKENLQELGNSKETALQRFCYLENKFKRQPVLQQNYSEFIEEYKQMHHMKLADENTTDQSKSYYIPHHAVFKPSSTTTKLRVVFDASCKTTTGRSLNDMLMVGPNLQDDLFSIIARFRTHKFIMIADIQKMYRQINIDSSQLNLQQIFWRNNLSDDIETYQLTTVTYGTSAAPYLAVKCLQQLAIEEKNDLATAAEVVLNDFYVDDMMTGSNTIEQGLKIQQEVITLLNRGGFTLHKWCSNAEELLKNIPDHLQETSNNLTVDSDDTIKTLGLTYHPRSDIFSFNISLNNSTQPVTKRVILSDISKIFDPLGLVGPVITRAKIIIQELWKLKLDWDESIPCSMFSNWLKFKDQLQNLNSIKIPRLVANTDAISHIELHGFCDASELAFGASIYLRTVYKEKSSANLLCSKSRVAPIKFTTIARLELCAAQLLVQLFEKVISTINIPVLRSFFWSDSTIVLHWLRAPAAHWKTYVANRVADIQQITNIGDWKHIRTHENPADLISRGVTADQLIHSSLWWHGPQFLSDSTTDFNDKGALDTLSFDDTNKWKEEQKPVAVTVLHSTTDQSINKFELLEKFSSFERLQRVMGYVLRFIRKSQKYTGEYNTIQLSVKELHQATQKLVKLSQAIDFQEEIKDLLKDKQVSAKSKLLSLTPFLDNEGIVRVGGRLQHSNLSEDQKHPMIMSSSSNLTKLIINFYHIKNLHAGPRALLSTVRQHFWPLKGKNLATQCVHQCIRCYRSKPVIRHQIMGDLPKHRIEPLRAFLNTGIDFCGPIFVRRGVRGQSHVKAYIAVFVCFATKAVHLELVGDLTTDSFLAALKRFISRRGRCANIYSDNATNFTGANRELSELQELFASEQHNNKVYSTMANEQIKWHFIPARSPHFGGLWEAAVKSAKHHLKRILDSTFLTYEEYTTVLAQVEAVLNSRPLTSLSNDPNDLSVLTPGHFLIGESMNCIPEPDYTPLMINRLSRWQRVQQIQQQFWQRWQTEYLTELQQRSKWKKKEPEIIIGSLVLLKDDNLPPLKWAMGRVICLHPGKDNINRVVTLKTSTGTMKRAITKVCLLPVEIEDTTSIEMNISTRAACSV